jgi:hypothetical protein
MSSYIFLCFLFNCFSSAFIPLSLKSSLSGNRLIFSSFDSINTPIVTPVSQVEDDGYSISNRNYKSNGILSNIFRKFIRPQPGALIIVRHGESEWNSNKTFTGWVDVDLSDRGCREVEHAGRLLLAGGYTVDVVYTSRLKRAIRTTWMLLKELNQIHRPVFKSWRLNERMY